MLFITVKAGLEYIADQIHFKTNALRDALSVLGYDTVKEPVLIRLKSACLKEKKIS